MQGHSSLKLEDVKAVGKIPSHVSIIMDGNGRWAGERFRPRIFGHYRGAASVRQVVECSRSLGIKYLTLFAFSDENWGRPDDEVKFIMRLLERFLVKEKANLKQNGIRLQAIGRLGRLPSETRKVLVDTMSELSANTDMTLTLCLSYGGRSEICNAISKIAERVKNGEIRLEEITQELVGEHLWTSGLPDPDLMIRTSGEVRISNFLLWQHAYSEFYFTKVSWPEFSTGHFLEAIQSFQDRQRRFGLVNKPCRQLSPAEIEELEKEDI